jgi:predicted neuraminidase
MKAHALFTLFVLTIMFTAQASSVAFLQIHSVGTIKVLAQGVPTLTLLGKSLLTHNGVLYTQAWAAAPVQAPDGSLLVAWDEANTETSDAQVISLKRSSDGGITWSAGMVVCQDVHADVEPQFGRIGTRLYLFWTECNTPAGSWHNWPQMIWFKYSDDSGYTWSPEVLITSGNTVQASNDLLVTRNGRWILPFYRMETDFKSSVLYSDNQGQTWSRGGDVPMLGLVEPTIVELSDGSLLMYMRNQNSGMYQYMSKSLDGGLTWSYPVATVPSPAAMAKLLKLKDGNFVLAWPDVSAAGELPRHPFVIALSTDNTASWSSYLTLESGLNPLWTGYHDFSNQGITQLTDGTIIVAYSDDTTMVDIYVARVQISGVGAYGSIFVQATRDGQPIVFQAVLDSNPPVAVPTVGYTFTSVPVGQHTVYATYDSEPTQQQIVQVVQNPPASLHFAFETVIPPPPPPPFMNEILVIGGVLGGTVSLAVVTRYFSIRTKHAPKKRRRR